MQKALEGMDAAKQIERNTPTPKPMNLGGVEQMVDMNPVTNPNIISQSFRKTATPDAVLSASTSRANNAATVGATMRGQDMTDARTRETLNQGKIPPGYRQNADGTLTAIPGGPADTQGKQSQASSKVLGLIDQANGLLDSSTGSYFGTGLDVIAQSVGESTKGARAAAQLKALEGSLMMAQPRMEGPQSDKDVALYRQMAAQIGDNTVPVKTRKAALETVRQLHEKYAQGATEQPQASSPGGAAVPIKSDADYDRLPSGTRFLAPDGTIRIKPGATVSKGARPPLSAFERN